MVLKLPVYLVDLSYATEVDHT